MPDSRLIEQIADTLGTNPGLVEKDWHVVRALATLASLDLGQTRLVFTGGTCLSKAWGLIQRFAEDVDFKAEVPAGYSRPQRRELRRMMEAALIGDDFSLVEPTTVRDEGRFFVLKLNYGSAFPLLTGLRPHIQIEVSLRTPKLDPVDRSIRSFIAQAQGDIPEVSSITCADPVETAAEKLSALSWRVLSHRNTPQGHDPSMMRHLHDLAALESRVANTSAFS